MDTKRIGMNYFMYILKFDNSPWGKYQLHQHKDVCYRQVATHPMTAYGEIKYIAEQRNVVKYILFTVQWSVLKHSIVQSYLVQFSTVKCIQLKWSIQQIVQYSAAQCSPIQYGAKQFSEVQWRV